MPTLLRLLLFVLLIAAPPVMAQEALELTLSAEKTGDTAKVFFHYPKVGTQAQIQAKIQAKIQDFQVRFRGDTVFVSFGKPVKMETAPLANLSDFLAGHFLNAEGVLVLRFKRSDYKVKKFSNASFSGLEITRPAEQKADAKPPQPAKKPAAPIAKKEPPKAVPVPVVTPIIPPQAEALPTPLTADGALNIKVHTFAEGLRLTFPWAERVALAAFTRSNSLWLVFDKPVLADLEAFNVPSEFIKSAKQFPSRHYTVLRLTLAKPLPPEHLRIYRQDFAWRMELLAKPLAASPLQPIPVVSQMQKQNVAVFLQALRTAEPLKWEDPVIGDSLIIIPLYEEGPAIFPARDFVEFSLLPTLQGIVIGQRSDEVQTTLAREGVYITSSKGLSLYSNQPQDEEKPSTALKRTPVQRFSALPFSDANLMGKDFIEAYSLLLNSVAEATGKEKTARHMKLANFLFSQKLFSEALGVLVQAGQDDLDVNLDPNYKFLLAATHFMMGHFEEANDLLAPLQQNPQTNTDEITMLKTASVLQIRPKLPEYGLQPPMKFEESYQYFLKQYPADIRQDLGFLAANQQLQKNNISAANGIHAVISSEPLSEANMNRLLLLQGNILDKEGDVEKAKETYEALASEVDDPEIRAKSGLSLQKLLLSHSLTTPEAAIEELEKLRFVWRGDDSEMELLGLLGQLYINQKDYASGLRTWRELTTQFPRTQEALYTAAKMREAFLKFFEEGEATNMPPFSMLALYFEFRELTPVGEAGDKIIRSLADSFIDADLLDNASTLLTHQVRFRSKGEEQQILSLKLASVYLQNRKPDLAIKALDGITKEGLSPEMQRQQTFLKVRALIEQAQYEPALELLKGDISDPAGNLKVEIYTKQKNWPGVIRIVEPRIFAMEKKELLSAEEARDVIRLAMGYVIDNSVAKIVNLKDLRTSFLEKMPDTASRDTLDFLTGDSDQIDFRNLTDTMKLEDMGAFMSRQYYWPSRDWTGVISGLRPIVQDIKHRTPAEHNLLTLAEKNQIIQLATAFAARGGSESIKSLQFLQQDFGSIEIDKNSAALFAPFNIPLTAFDPPVKLMDMESFVAKYKEQLAPKKPGDTTAPAATAAPAPATAPNRITPEKPLPPETTRPEGKAPPIPNAVPPAAISTPSAPTSIVPPKAEPTAPAQP